jgi:hypothetical protein
MPQIFGEDSLQQYAEMPHFIFIMPHRLFGLTIPKASQVLTEAELQQVLLRHEVQEDPKSEVQRELHTNLRNEIASVVKQIDDPELREIAQDILWDLVRFFDWLAQIDSNLHKLDTLLECLSILEILQVEAHSLTDFIDTKAMTARVVSDRMREVLDGISYGITHDLRRIFEQEFVGRTREQSTPLVYGKILHAHGLLTNTFQQSVITLLQCFKPDLEASVLFNDAELRLEQSLILCRDLSSLISLTRRAETHPEPDVLRKVVGRILEFRDGTMHYLMYKDWQGYESLALELITAIENNLETKPLLNRFVCYLEVLYGHVKMRAVLADNFPFSANFAHTRDTPIDFENSREIIFL